MTTNDPIVIVAAKRTPIGNFNGGLSTLPAHDLGAVAIRAVMDEAKVGGADIDEVIMGQVLTAAAGQNPARQAAMAAGIPHDKTALTVNQVCGSGLRTVALGMQSILNGDATVIVAGGQENMSLSPHAMHMRNGTKMGNATMVDTMIVDGLWDAFNGYHMGMTAENIAEKWQITRADQDNFAAASQQKTEAAQKAGKFTAEITPVKIKVKKDEVIIDKDEFPRAGVTVESLAGLRPAFKPDGTVTAASASGINDGAAAVVLMRASEAKKRGLPVYATIRSWATAGVDPAVMGSGPIPASRKALEKAGWSVSDLDLVEANEAFAAQSLCVLKDLALDPAKVNVNGGAIAIGHPIGASGTRVLVTLLHEMARRDVKRGLVTLCIGGGMGIAMCVERDASENLKKVA
ncbi:acetyl-CoA C-acetyltransferase [Micavibrio aeruginosavorus]|uniref:Acetyl-CoA acetyltransferase n=1 Tax=Micavibrio aeruginosavorus (strain ARL-13) TaxID=856793 RepID=G2KLR4_MICAA|nr:acetyl-CoA C-acetyltransferase [Micavibrio aeruginosavorus]AEP09293.1 acetyl-CoA acetyltransferase [Micavibrio aeruginosavorus ARL-13]